MLCEVATVDETRKPKALDVLCIRAGVLGGSLHLEDAADLRRVHTEVRRVARAKRWQDVLTEGERELLDLAA